MRQLVRWPTDFPLIEQRPMLRRYLVSVLRHHGWTGHDDGVTVTGPQFLGNRRVGEPHALKHAAEFRTIIVDHAAVTLCHEVTGLARVEVVAFGFAHEGAITAGGTAVARPTG